jgi:GT2 family glycosyltransferase
MSRPDVSVIIVSFSTRDLLRECLRSVAEKTVGVTHEVVVVDNASCDGSVAMVREEFPMVRVIANTENRGFAAANNQGIGATDSRYVALLNTDAFLLNDALHLMVAYLDERADVAVVGPRMVDERGKTLATAHAFENPKRLLLKALPVDGLLPRRLKQALAPLGGREALTYMANFQADRPVEVDWVSGACMAVRRSAIAQVGLLDEEYFMYMEDEDWCRRMRQQGWRTVLLPTARVRHLVSASPTTHMDRLRRYYRSRRIYHRKHSPRAFPLMQGLLAAHHGIEVARARCRLWRQGAARLSRGSGGGVGA